MSFLKGEARATKDPPSFPPLPGLKESSLVVGWSSDAAKLGNKVIDYLNKTLSGQKLYGIEPVEFYPLGGVTVEDNVALFPESTFYICPGKGLVIFKSTPPAYDWYKFLKLVLDIAEKFRVKEIHTLGGMVSLGAHSNPTELMATFSSPEFKQELSSYQMVSDWDYETPPGQRPTLNSFLLWEARNRSIPAVAIWVPVPFYLVTLSDPRAEKKVLEFFDRRFSLRLDFSDLDDAIKKQNIQLAGIRNEHPDIDGIIKKLESNQSLSAEENQKLIKDIEGLIKGTSA